MHRCVGTDTLSDKPAKNEKKIAKDTEKIFEHLTKRLTVNAGAGAATLSVSLHYIPSREP